MPATVKELVDLLGTPRDKITVIPEGVDERVGADVDPKAAKTAYGLDKP